MRCLVLDSDDVSRGALVRPQIRRTPPAIGYCPGDAPADDVGESAGVKHPTPSPKNWGRSDRAGHGFSGPLPYWCTPGSHVVKTCV